MNTTPGFVAKVRQNYLLLLFLVTALLWWLIFSAMMIGSGTDLGLFGYLVIETVVSLAFGAVTLVLYRIIKRAGLYAIIGMLIIIPLFVLLLVKVAHWIVMRIYTGDQENLVPGYGIAAARAS